MVESPTAAVTDPNETSHPTLLFDGDCGFCTTSAGWLRRLSPPPELEVIPSWSVDIDALGLSTDDVARCVWFVGTNGSLYPAEIAVARALQQSSRRPVRLIGSFIGLPGVRSASARIYRLVAANRHRLPGSTDACRIS